jgi:hypothetical protein
MVQLGVVYHLQNRLDGSRLGVGRSVNQAADSGMNCRSRAHGARFNCSKEVAADETMVSNGSSGFAERDDFGMRAWVFVEDIAIPPSSYDVAVADDYGSDGHVSGLERALGTAQRFVHPQLVFVIVTWVGGAFFSRRIVRWKQLFAPVRGWSGEFQPPSLLF